MKRQEFTVSVVVPDGTEGSPKDHLVHAFERAWYDTRDENPGYNGVEMEIIHEKEETEGDW